MAEPVDVRRIEPHDDSIDTRIGMQESTVVTGGSGININLIVTGFKGRHEISEQDGLKYSEIFETLTLYVKDAVENDKIPTPTEIREKLVNYQLTERERLCFVAYASDLSTEFKRWKDAISDSGRTFGRGFYSWETGVTMGVYAGIFALIDGLAWGGDAALRGAGIGAAIGYITKNFFGYKRFKNDVASHLAEQYKTGERLIDTTLKRLTH